MWSTNNFLHIKLLRLCIFPLKMVQYWGSSSKSASGIFERSIWCFGHCSAQRRCGTNSAHVMCTWAWERPIEQSQISRQFNNSSSSRQLFHTLLLISCMQATNDIASTSVLAIPTKSQPYGDRPKRSRLVLRACDTCRRKCVLCNT